MKAASRQWREPQALNEAFFTPASPALQVERVIFPASRDGNGRACPWRPATVTCDTITGETEFER